MLNKLYEQGKDLHVANYMAYGKTADHKLYADVAFKETVTKEEIEDAFKKGRLVIMAPKSEAEKIVEVLRQCPYSKDAAIIGEVTEEQPGHVVMTTEIGTQALLPQPGGELLPRIC